ncbi:MAG TPA: glycosyltransferase [Opitutales bacterium]|nr:glycosyltransferase [Opitutales bacterium]
MNEAQKKIRVAVLPIAGKEDPTQMLMMQAVEASGRFELKHGVHARFFAATRSYFKLKPDLFYFDWITRYHAGRNIFVTWLKLAAFWLDVKIVTQVFRRPIVWSLHNLHSHERTTAAEARERAVQRFFARRATLIRVFSQGTVARTAALLEVNAVKLRVVPVGNYINYYRNEISPSTARTRLGLAHDDFVLLWLGSIRPYKGLHELLEAFRLVAKSNWRLVVAGRPYIEDYAREIAVLAQSDSRIQLHFRFIPLDELQVYYNAADAVALPFVEVENTSSLVVAMGFRKPIVAPDLGIIGERLCHQRELVYAPGELITGLKTLAGLSTVRRSEIGAANFEEASRHDWSDLAPVLAEAVNLSLA